MTVKRALMIGAIVCLVIAAMSFEQLKGWAVGWLGIALWCAAEVE